MPGIAGWLGGELNQDLLEPEGICTLLADHSYRIEKIPSVRNGTVYLISTAATPVSQGFLHDHADGTTIAYWGEFYGRPYCDCESGSDVCQKLRCLLSDEPEEFLRNLDGSFVIFVQNGDRQFLAADPIGSRPLFYSRCGLALLFSPELKLFGHTRHSTPRLNRNALVSFLVNGHPISDATYFSGVRLLRPGHYISMAGNVFTVRRYAQHVPADPNARDLGTFVYRERLAETLRNAIRKRTRYLGRSVFPISGGYDSRGILACIREIYGGPLMTVTWGTDEKDPEADGAIGRRVAQYIGADHHFLQRRSDMLLQDLEPMVHQTDAANDDCFFHHHEQYLIRTIKNDLDRDVLFRGDECFGYGSPATSAEEALSRVGVHNLSQFPNLHCLFQKDVLATVMEEQLDAYYQLIHDCPYRNDWTMAKDWFYLEQRLFRCLNFSHYTKLSLIEARNPWLDKDVLSFFADLPVHYRYNKCLYRETTDRMFPALFRTIPIAKRQSLEDWREVLLRNPDFRSYVKKQLIDGQSIIHEIWAPDALNTLLNDFYSGKASAAFQSRLVEDAKCFLRQHVGPVYRLLKKRAARHLMICTMRPEIALGRLLVLKLWCDRWG